VYILIEKNMKNNLKYGIITAIVVALVAALVGGLVYWQSLPGKYDDLAKCLKDKGAVFYGAFWCPHCQNQKATFGKSAKYLPYVECSLPSGQGITNECKAREDIIKGYPTWLFPDGTTMSGEISLEVLAERTSCPLTPEVK
jgi:hypothetical protein